MSHLFTRRKQEKLEELSKIELSGGTENQVLTVTSDGTIRPVAAEIELPSGTTGQFLVYGSVGSVEATTITLNNLSNDAGFITGVAWNEVSSKPGWTEVFDGTYASLTGEPNSIGDLDAGLATTSADAGYLLTVTPEGLPTFSDFGDVAAKLGEGVTAHSWGNHASAGYMGAVDAEILSLVLNVQNAVEGAIIQLRAPAAGFPNGEWVPVDVSPSDGDVLQWNDTAKEWQAKAAHELIVEKSYVATLSAVDHELDMTDATYGDVTTLLVSPVSTDNENDTIKLVLKELVRDRTIKVHNMAPEGQGTWAKVTIVTPGGINGSQDQYEIPRCGTAQILTYNNSGAAIIV